MVVAVGTPRVVGEGVQVAAAVHSLLEAVGASWDSVEPVEDRKGHDRRYSVDITKIGSELGYAPRVSFEDGLAATVAWYTDNRAWWEPLAGRTALRK